MIKEILFNDSTLITFAASWSPWLSSSGAVVAD
jgi:hypothetical protein